jgi:uncharacterized Zn finger protein
MVKKCMSCGSGGKVRNRGLKSVRAAIAKRRCKEQGSVRSGLVKVSEHARAKAHVRCYPKKRQSAVAAPKKKKSRKGVSSFGKKLRRSPRLIKVN